MKVKTSNLAGAALDYAVAKAEGRTDVRIDDDGELVGQQEFDYSTDWAQGGPIIERGRITLKPEWDGENESWTAISITRFGYRAVQNGLTPLIAAMRCYCCSKLGDEVEIPEELA